MPRMPMNAATSLPLLLLLLLLLTAQAFSAAVKPTTTTAAAVLDEEAASSSMGTVESETFTVEIDADVILTTEDGVEPFTALQENQFSSTEEPLPESVLQQLAKERAERQQQQQLSLPLATLNETAEQSKSVITTTPASVITTQRYAEAKLYSVNSLQDMDMDMAAMQQQPELETTTYMSPLEETASPLTNLGNYYNTFEPQAANGEEQSTHISQLASQHDTNTFEMPYEEQLIATTDMAMPEISVARTMASTAPALAETTTEAAAAAAAAVAETTPEPTELKDLMLEMERQLAKASMYNDNERDELVASIEGDTELPLLAVDTNIEPQSTDATPQQTQLDATSNTEIAVNTTNVAETTTSPPETTESAPQTTTNAPATTTSAPQTTTNAPVTTTSAPQTTANAPETTESSPITSSSSSSTEVYFTTTAETTTSEASTTSMPHLLADYQTTLSPMTIVEYISTTSMPATTTAASTTAPPSMPTTIEIMSETTTMSPETSSSTTEMSTTSSPTTTPTTTTTSPTTTELSLSETTIATETSTTLMSTTSSPTTTTTTTTAIPTTIPIATRATRAPRIERIFNSDGVEVLYGYSSVVRTNRS